MKNHIKLQPGETLRFDKSKRAGFVGVKTIDFYSILDADGKVVGSIEHKTNISIHGLNTSQSIIQKDMFNKIVHEENWDYR